MFNKSQYDDSKEIINNTQNQNSRSKRYSSQTVRNVFNLIKIYEMHRDSKCSEEENIQASIIMALITCLTLSIHVMFDGSNIFLQWYIIFLNIDEYSN